MRPTRLLTLSAVAALLAVPVAHAGDTCHDATYEGADARGRIVRLTVPETSVVTFNRVSPQHPPQPHWTSRIGTGTAAALER